MEGNILESIYKAALKFLSPLSLEETYRIIVNEAVKLVDGEYGSIVVRKGAKFEKVYSSSDIGYKTKVRKKAFAYKAFKENKAIIAHISKTGKAHPELKKIGIRSTIHIPLSYKSNSIGVLIVNSKKDQEFGKKDLEILQLFGSLASLSIRKTELYDETIKALEIRDQFISMSAHELRTPLTTISGYIQLLSLKLGNNNSREARWVNELQWEVFRLTQLVNELVAVNRIQSGQLQYSWKKCSLKEIIKRSINNFNFAHPDYEIVFQDNIDGRGDLIIGDFDKLIQVVDNVLDNAAKFSKSANPINVKLTNKVSQIVLEVLDKGKGISKEEKDKIFDAFYMGKNHTREGIGIGLFLTQNIIKRHHGIIKIQSRVGKGTKVAIKIPIAKV